MNFQDDVVTKKDMNKLLTILGGFFNYPETEKFEQTYGQIVPNFMEQYVINPEISRTKLVRQPGA